MCYSTERFRCSVPPSRAIGAALLLRCGGHFYVPSASIIASIRQGNTSRVRGNLTNMVIIECYNCLAHCLSPAGGARMMAWPSHSLLKLLHWKAISSGAAERYGNGGDCLHRAAGCLSLGESDRLTYRTRRIVGDDPSELPWVEVPDWCTTEPPSRTCGCCVTGIRVSDGHSPGRVALATLRTARIARIMLMVSLIDGKPQQRQCGNGGNSFK